MATSPQDRGAEQYRARHARAQGPVDVTPPTPDQGQQRPPGNQKTGREAYLNRHPQKPKENR